MLMGFNLYGTPSYMDGSGRLSVQAARVSCSASVHAVLMHECAVIRTLHTQLRGLTLATVPSHRHVRSMQ